MIKLLIIYNCKLYSLLLLIITFSSVQTCFISDLFNNSLLSKINDELPENFRIGELTRHNAAPL